MGACGLRQIKAVKKTNDKGDVVSGDENMEDGKKLHFVVVDLWFCRQ